MHYLYQMMRRYGVFGVLLSLFLLSGTGEALAQSDNARVVVPDVPGGALVSGCYRSVGVIYGKYRLNFCLKRHGTYKVIGNGLRCNGRIDWDTKGIGVNIRFKRTSCGNGVAWSADTAWCRPSLLLGIIGIITDSGKPMLSGLTCDYKPVKGTGHKPIFFGAKRIN